MLDLWLLYLHLASSLPARKYLLITLHLSHFHDDDDHHDGHHDHVYRDGGDDSDDHDNDDDGDILPIQMSHALIHL